MPWHTGGVPVGACMLPRDVCDQLCRGRSSGCAGEKEDLEKKKRTEMKKVRKAQAAGAPSGVVRKKFKGIKLKRNRTIRGIKIK